MRSAGSGVHARTASGGRHATTNIDTKVWFSFENLKCNWFIHLYFCFLLGYEIIWRWCCKCGWRSGLARTFWSSTWCLCTTSSKEFLFVFDIVCFWYCLFLLIFFWNISGYSSQCSSSVGWFGRIVCFGLVSWTFDSRWSTCTATSRYIYFLFFVF